MYVFVYYQGKSVSFPQKMMNIKRYQGRLGLAVASASGSNPSTCNSTSTTRPSGGWVMVMGLGGVTSQTKAEYM